MLPCPRVHIPAPTHAPSLASRLGLFAALSLALAASAPAAEIGLGASVNVGVHADVHIPVPVVRVPVPVVAVPVPVVAAPVVVAPPPPPPVVVHTVHYRGELSCEGDFYYQAHASSTWVTHEHGAFTLEFPARIRTGHYPCHIAIAGFGEFYAAPDSEFLVNPNAESLYDLRIFRGGVRYAVSSRATLRVSSAFGLGACVNGERATVAHPYRGRAFVYGEDALQLENLDGDLAFERDGHSVRQVTAGHGLRISLATARERSAERELIYHDVDAYAGADDYSAGTYRESRSYYDSFAGARGKSSRKTKVSYSEETEVREDTHSHQVGKGHYEHGNGKGLGHYKEHVTEHHEETVSVQSQSYATRSYEKDHGKAQGHGKERHEEAIRVQTYSREDDIGHGKDHGKAPGRDKDRGHGNDRGNDHGNGKGKGKGHGK